MKQLSVNDFLKSFTPPSYLINGFLKSKSHGFLAGTTGSFKSFIALDIAHCVGTGRAFLGHEIKQSGKVLYIAGEGIDGLHKRFSGLFERYGSCDNIYLYPSELDLSDDAHIQELSDYVVELNPILIIYDTLNSLSGGLENNSSSNVNLFYKRICNISNSVGSSTLIVHHFGKDASKGMEGSHAFRSNADYVYALHSNGNLSVNLIDVKQKDRAADSPIQVELEEVILNDPRHADDNKTLLVKSYGSTTKALTKSDKLIDFISSNGVVSMRDITNYFNPLGIKINNNELKRLVDRGSVVSINDGALKRYKVN